MNSTQTSRWTSVFGRKSAPSAPPADASSGELPVDGLHVVRRAADDWFDQHVVELEASAVEMARDAAAARLPRTDVAYEKVEEEETLASRAGSIFRGWVERVRARVQDSIQGSARRSGAQLARYEHELVELEIASARTTEATAALATAEEAAAAGHANVEVRGFLGRWKYAVLVLLLVVVDWVANVPVFSELLPKDPGADAAWRIVVAESEQYGIWGGAYRVFARALHNIDASLLALGVIIFLVFLAHVLGESLRRRTSLSEKETPSAATTIRGHRRQFGVTALASMAGIAAVLGFLYFSRVQLEATTTAQLVQAEAALESVQTQLAAARTAEDLEAIGAAEQQRDAALRVRDQRAERADYARVISRMNLPILLLNLVLAIAAALAAYLTTSDSVRGALDSPRAAELRIELRDLRREMVRRRDTLRELEIGILNEFANANYLLHSRPLQGWEAKADRLRAVIPRFRSENARSRGIDTANIAAFQRPVVLQFAPGDDADTITAPAELLVQQERHETLKDRARRLMQTSPAEATTTERVFT